MNSQTIPLKQAVQQLLLHEPFFAHILAGLPILIVEGNTLHLDPKLQITIGTQWLQKYQNSLPAALINQILKIILLHPQRQENRIPQLWNLACNLYNAQLIAKNYNIPLPDTLKELLQSYASFLTHNPTEEELYQLLRQQNQQNNSPSPDQNQKDEKLDQNSSQNNDEAKSQKNQNQNTDESENTGETNDENHENNPTENPAQNDDINGDNNADNNDENTDNNSEQNQTEFDDRTDQTDTTQSDANNRTNYHLNENNDNNNNGEAMPETWQKVNEMFGTMSENQEFNQQELQQATLVANQLVMLGQKMGNIPAFAQKELDKLHKPKQSLLQFIEQFVAKGITPTRYNWLRPNRRYAKDFFIPRIEGDRTSGIACAFDTSGSFWHIVDKTLNLIMEVWERADRAEPIHILYCDTNVHHQLWRSRRDVAKPHGGGGTSYAPIMEWLAQNTTKHNLQALLYITDGECSDFGKKPPIPVFWLFVPTYTGTRFQPPFGKVITIPAYKFT